MTGRRTVGSRAGAAHIAFLTLSLLLVTCAVGRYRQRITCPGSFLALGDAHLDSAVWTAAATGHHRWVKLLHRGTKGTIADIARGNSPPAVADISSISGRRRVVVVVLLLSHVASIPRIIPSRSPAAHHLIVHHFPLLHSRLQRRQTRVIGIVAEVAGALSRGLAGTISLTTLILRSRR